MGGNWFAKKGGGGGGSGGAKKATKATPTKQPSVSAFFKSVPPPTPAPADVPSEEPGEAAGRSEEATPDAAAASAGTRPAPRTDAAPPAKRARTEAAPRAARDAAKLHANFVKKLCGSVPPPVHAGRGERAAECEVIPLSSAAYGRDAGACPLPCPRVGAVA